jgi:cell division protein FtsZ
MISSNLEGVDFFVANTDAQALANSLATNKIKFGITSTKGLGAGSDPKVGAIAAEESTNEIIEALDRYNLIFITAGMGGGTGTGGAPIVAKIAKERNILTVGVVTKPFHFEGARRMKTAEEGLDELQKFVDTLIIIPNQNLFRLANEKTTFADAFNIKV